MKCLQSSPCLAVGAVPSDPPQAVEVECEMPSPKVLPLQHPWQLPDPQPLSLNRGTVDLLPNDLKWGRVHLPWILGYLEPEESLYAALGLGIGLQARH